MPQTIVITDLTRFNKEDNVCIAGIDPATGKLIRPYPYLKSSQCKKHGIYPGGKLVSTFKPKPNLIGPHQEDCSYGELLFQGPASKSEFRGLLAKSASASVNEGFGSSLESGDKVLPANHDGKNSIITLKLPPSRFRIVPNRFEPQKIKARFTDGAGVKFDFLSITDLGFHDYAIKHHQNDELNAVNDWIQEQDELFLRIGLSRAFKHDDGRSGFWLQVNGIYTFPDKHPAIRKYVE